MSNIEKVLATYIILNAIFLLSAMLVAQYRNRSS